MRRLNLLTIALAVCIFFTGCTNNFLPSAQQEESRTGQVLVGNIPVTFPLVSEPKTMNIMISSFNGKNQDNVYVWKKYEEKTGIKVNWTCLTREERSEAYHTALTNNQQYDLILRCKIPAASLANYGKSGLILDLMKNDLLKENAPNCWAYLESHPDALASVMNPDGTIYALPQINSGAELRVCVKMYVNKYWLERVDMKLPSTTEELKTLLMAFRDKDANGNGNVSDEIPLCVDWSGFRMIMLGSFGLANRGVHNETMDADPVTGKVRMVEASDEYKQYLEYVSDLYQNKMIDENLFDLKTEQLLGNIADDKVGVFASTNLAQLPADKADDWLAIEETLTGPNGDRLASCIRANFHSTGAAVIPATCTNPELVLQWLDYFWTDEGTLFYHMGEEGETYKILEDGTYEYLPKIYEEMKEKNLSFDEVVSDYSPYPGGSNPTVEIAPYFMGGEMAKVPADAARALMKYGPKEYWPSFTFTQEENEALEKINGDLEKYCNNMCVDFVTGVRSFEEWDEYINKIEKLGKTEKIKIYQAAVDRYHTIATVLN